VVALELHGERSEFVLELGHVTLVELRLLFQRRLELFA
jgi:hypothetical protein